MYNTYESLSWLSSLYNYKCINTSDYEIGIPVAIC